MTPAPPQTYAAWADLLERCGQGDDRTLDWLGQGSWQPDAGTAARFANLVNTAYAARKQRWLAAFKRSQTVGPAVRSSQEFALLLRQATVNLGPLYCLTRLAALPPGLRDTLQADLATFIQDVRNSLRDNIMQTAGNQREELLLALRSFGVAPAQPVAATEPPPPAPGTGRRIIF